MGSRTVHTAPRFQVRSGTLLRFRFVDSPIFVSCSLASRSKLSPGTRPDTWGQAKETRNVSPAVSLRPGHPSSAAPGTYGTAAGRSRRAVAIFRVGLETVTSKAGGSLLHYLGGKNREKSCSEQNSWTNPHQRSQKRAITRKERAFVLFRSTW